MSTLIRCYPGDRNLDFLLVVTLGVTLASSAAWLISRRLASRAALRHLVLLSALFCCLISPVLVWICVAGGLTLVSLHILHDEQGRMTSRVTPMETDSVAMPPQPSAGPLPLPTDRPLPDTDPTLHRGADIVVATAPDDTPAISIPSAPEIERTIGPTKTALSYRGVVTGALFVWGTGVLLLLARLTLNWGRVMQLRRSSYAWPNDSRQPLLQELGARLGGNPHPQILVSSRSISPLAAGIVRPAVILPERLLGTLNDDELNDVIIHEAAHLQRGDQWIVLLQELAAALYWPIVSLHGLNRELQRAREELCDNVVLASRNAIRYGETLLHVAELLVQARPMHAAAGIFGGPGDLEQRITGLIDPRRNTTTTTGRRTACAVMFAFIAGGAITSATRFAPAARAAAPATGAVAEAARPDEREKVSTAADSGAQATPADPKTPGVSPPDDPQFAVHLRGRVTGPDGKPISSARVFFVPESDGPADAPQVRATTDADGRFEFDAPDMTVVDLDGLRTRRQGILSATADGYAPDWRPIWGRPQAGAVQWHAFKGDLTLQLPKDDVPIHGRFLDPDGQPLAGALVRLNGLMFPQKHDLDAHLDREVKFTLVNVTNYERELHQPALLPGLTTEMRTDADGRFTLSGLGRDRLVSLTVSAPSVVDTHLTVMTRDVPDVRTRLGGQDDPFPNAPHLLIHGAGFTLQLERGRTISGIVRDVSSKKPIPGMWIGLRHVEGAGMWVELSSKNFPFVTDKNGRFTITGLHPKMPKKQVVAIAPPGVNYQPRSVVVEGDAEVVVETYHGIPFHLKLADEEGRPVDADVTYVDLWPNPYNSGNRAESNHWPVSRAARKLDGTYEGFVLSGPGAVLVKPQRPGDFRPARVDPKAFFAPGWTEKPLKEEFPLYGTWDTLTVRGPAGRTPQNDYAAIVLINPTPRSGPLELSATVMRQAARLVRLIDPEGEPVVGARTDGVGFNAWNPARTLRAASFSLTALDPDRIRRIRFYKDDRQLIGFLLARGDGDTPYTVQMQPWGTVTGRIVDENGEDLPIWKPESDYLGPPKLWADINGDPEAGGDRHSAEADTKGRFRIDKLVPGQPYSAQTYSGMWSVDSKTAFDNLVLSAGEVRDLGDIRVKLSYTPSYRRPTEDDEQATAMVPAEAWGEPVDGLRVAIVWRSPRIDKFEQLSYEIVAENVSDHEIRFGAGNHYEYGFCKIRLVDVDGKELPRQSGALPNWVDTLPFIRFRLKPKERTVISRCAEKLVKLNEAGQPLPSPKRNEYYHFFNVKPGRYSVSATVELGSGIDRPDPASEPRKLLFAAKGEWTGKLQTGVVATTLFEDADK